MGRTVSSYRLASEIERRKWKIFRDHLDKSEALEKQKKCMNNY
jgi:hypothetical protein